MKNKSVDEFIIDVLRGFKKNKKRILNIIKLLPHEGNYVEIPFFAAKICLARYNIKKRKFVHIEVLLNKDVRMFINL